MNAFTYNLDAPAGTVVLLPGNWIGGTAILPAAPSAPALPSKPLGVAIKEMLAAKERANCRPKYVLNLRQFFGAFARGREAMPLSAVGVDEVEEWLGQRHKTPASRETGINRIRTLMSFALRRGWITTNPCERLDRVRIDHGIPSTFDVPRCRELLRVVVQHEPRCLAWFVLGLFVGLRPSEADLTDWHNVNLEAGTVTVDAAACKTRRRRVVECMPAAVAWLRFARDHGLGRLDMSHATRRRALRRICQALGLKGWPQDVLRHTAATFLLAELQDAGKVAHRLGNSAGVLMRHYIGLVTRQQAAEFWALRPPTR